jgi:hypothetical protein
MTDILHALMLNQNIIDEIILINYTEKPVTKKLSQTINGFSNI